MKKLTMCAALLGAMMLAGSAAAYDQSGVQVGTLTCHEGGGWGLVLGSSHRMRCTFVAGDGRAERYDGNISKFGVDLGYQQGGVIVWAVIAPTDYVGQGDLAGHYGGATAHAAFGGGVGANVLIGGFHRSFSLQPVSFEGETGLNVAAGIADLRLTPHPTPRQARR